jgi:chorismate mutase / prephenate dehydratase
MAKRSTPTRRGSPGSASQCKQSLDKVNRDLVRLLNEHARLAERWAHCRHEEGGLLHDLGAEQQLLQQVVESHRGPLSERCLRAIFRELISGTRAMVKTLRVAYLGPTYSYSHLAAIERFGSSAELVPVATIAAVFEELNRAHVNFGIVPIENSTDGRVVDTLGMFTRLPVRICGEVQLRIHHFLLGKCQRADILEVYSKPQALSQCREWVAKHLPQARTIEMTSTAAAAQLAAEKPGAAAIASLQAGVNYGLNVLAENIEDNKNNITRFAVIGDHEGRRTGRDKTAAMFEIPHTPGSLADAMTVFKRNRINLTWIESFPMPNTESEYLFFVEMEGYHGDAKVKRALTALERKTERLEILGSYAKSPPVE